MDWTGIGFIALGKYFLLDDILAGPTEKGTIPNLNTDPGVAPTDDAILRIITNLRTGNDAIGPHKAFAPAGFHNGLQLQMTAGPDGIRVWNDSTSPR